MELIRNFFRYAKDFEKTYKDDDWSRLEPYLSLHAIYRVENVPFACEIEGRQAILTAIRRSCDGFDRKGTRQVGLLKEPREEASRVILYGFVEYSFPEKATLRLNAQTVAEYEEGSIRSLVDTYDEGSAEICKAWFRQNGDGLDPSYR
ncbi:MAG: hypothetical protein K0U98_24895 [Deltaproteobacteria bacterium]|nr:hypothetical protein [Deltaproteobacteria bacterium]